MSKGAKKIWLEIVGERPVDYFRSGARTLLAQFCEMAATQEENMAMMRADPLNPEFQKLVRDMGNSLNMTAAKLRLSIQTNYRPDNGKMAEKEASPEGKDAMLYGSNVVRF